MKRFVFLFSIILFFGAGCEDGSMGAMASLFRMASSTAADSRASKEVILPVEDYAARANLKVFGEYIQDRFRGYHAADDVEFTDEASIKREIPVVAMADGKVTLVQFVSGYGGLIKADHVIDGKTYHALYGHVDLGSAKVKKGDMVGKGQFLAHLGDHTSKETDGERKHLHFGLYEGVDERVNGYEPSATGLKRWINPTTFFSRYGLLRQESRVFDPAYDIGGTVYRLRFAIPAGWEVEYIPSIQALNLFTLEGEGVARERSQIFIRYFDAAEFQTLASVQIHKTEELNVGKGDYGARRYEIEKKVGIAPFADQPSWRNERHVVTDFRGKEGRTRYYVVAANPLLPQEVYEEVLASMEILP
jgi:hypothetical protein